MRAIAAVLLLGAIAVLGVLFWVGAADPETAHVPVLGDTKDVAPVDLQAPPSIESEPASTTRAADPDRTDVTGLSPSEKADPSREPAAVGPSVLVLDASGNPVGGVPVLAIKARHIEFVSSIATALTGEDGVATFSPLPDTESPCRALLGFPHFPPIEAAFPTSAEDSPSILRMPATGSLLVRVLDEQGAPFVDAGPVKTSLAGFVVNGRRGGFEVTPDSSCVALFPRVGLGLLLDIEVRLGEFDEWMVRSGVVGPAVPGERVEAVFRGYEQPVITGILVDRSGDTLSNAAINVTTYVEKDGTSSNRRFDARTDEVGRFRVLLHENLRSGATRGIRLSDGTGSAGRYLTVDLSRELSGVVDLGVLVMTGATLICGGRVVDDYGAPVEGAGLATALVGACELVSMEKSAVRTDAVGRFQWFGVTDCERLRVGASKVGYFAAERELVTVGESQVEIVLTRGGSVSGSLGRFEGFPVQRLTLTLRRSEDASDRGKRTTPNGSGSFQFSALEAGVYTLEVSAARLLCTVENIVVPAGQDVMDPRLQSLGLPSTGRLIAIEVVDERGTPRSASVSVTESDGRSGGAVALDTGRFAYLTMSREPVTVLAAAPGCRSATSEELVSDQARLTLHPGIPIKLIASGSDTIRDGERMLGARLHSGSGSDLIWFDGNREALTTASKAGEWRVEWFLRSGIGGGFTASGVDDPAPQKIRVEDSDSLQVFQVTPPPGAMDESG